METCQFQIARPGDRSHVCGAELVICEDCKNVTFCQSCKRCNGTCNDRGLRGASGLDPDLPLEPLYALPIFTNAHCNRKEAERAVASGVSPQALAENFPEVWGLNAEGQLFQKYEYQFRDGRKETSIRTSQDAMTDLMREHKKGSPFSGKGPPLEKLIDLPRLFSDVLRAYNQCKKYGEFSYDTLGRRMGYRSGVGVAKYFASGGLQCSPDLALRLCLWMGRPVEEYIPVSIRNAIKHS